MKSAWKVCYVSLFESENMSECNILKWKVPEKCVMFLCSLYYNIFNVQKEGERWVREIVRVTARDSVCEREQKGEKKRESKREWELRDGEEGREREI